MLKKLRKIYMNIMFYNNLFFNEMLNYIWFNKCLKVLNILIIYGNKYNSDINLCFVFY